MKKRLLAILTVIALTAGMIVPGSAFAEGRNGWETAADGSRYYYQDGVKAVGAKSISGVIYVFEASGRLHNKEGLFSVNGKEYCLTASGTAKTGFVIFKENKKEKAAYFDKSSGEMLKGRMVGYLRLPNSGRLNAAYVRGIKFLNKHGWNLKRAFFAVVKKTKYAYRRMRRKNMKLMPISDSANTKGIAMYLPDSSMYVLNCSDMMSKCGKAMSTTKSIRTAGAQSKALTARP